MQDIAQVATEVAAKGMTTSTLLWIIGGMMAVITTLGEVIKTQYQKRTNPLNGTLGRLDTTLSNMNITLSKVAMRSDDQNSVLVGQTEKLVMLSATLAQVAASGERQANALVGLPMTIDSSITGAATRIIAHSESCSAAILEALDSQ